MDMPDLELIVVREGSHRADERRAVARDAERRLLERLRRGVYVERAAFLALSPEAQHLIRMRAVAAVVQEPIAFSHSSALVARALPVRRSRLDRVHATFATNAERGREGVTGHVLPLRPEEVTTVGGLLVTTRARTVVDIAGSTPFAEGVAVADAVLRKGTPRAELEAAIALAGPRRAARRIADVVGFAHPGAGSVGESYSRTTMCALGIAPPELQHLLWDDEGFVAWLDFWFPHLRIGGESDGKVKLLDPAMAVDGAGVALWKEKRREDRILPLVSGLARWGWEEAGDQVLLGRKLAAFGVLPATPRATIADYIAAARDARPRPSLPSLLLR